MREGAERHGNRDFPGGAKFSSRGGGGMII